MINDGEKRNKNIIQQHQMVDHEEIKKYPLEHQHEITSSIFCNTHHEDLHVNNTTIKEHFSNKRNLLGEVNF